MLILAIQMSTFISAISNKQYPLSQKVMAALLRPNIFEMIKKDYPLIDHNSLLADVEINVYRQKYIEELLRTDKGSISKIDNELLQLIKNEEFASEISSQDNTDFTFGQKIADKVAEFGGSWTFIISFLSFLAIWILINIFWYANRGFDPYPFILLNLILSCIAALQAPVIMMSQNRQEEKDRLRAINDYKINLKSEIEIRMLHEKIDHLMLIQQQKLMEVQEIQMEMLNEIMLKLKN